ncbi:MAG: MFS transporter [Azospirillaceae bacterium]
MIDYLRFLKEAPRPLAFGFLLCFASSFGQTFFIALSGAELRAAFELSHGGFGTAYSVATLGSGLLMIWLGGLLDRVSLGRFSLAVVIGLAGACALLAVAPHAAVLVLAFFALRLTGQGLATHTAFTTMGRRFVMNRGKAIAIAALGLPAGEAVLPLLGVGAIDLFGWRGAWLAFGAVALAGFAPLTLWLSRAAAQAPQLRTRGADDPPEPRQWSRAEVLRDTRFWLILPALLAMPVISTAFFFHQVHVVEAKGWSLTWFAAMFPVFAGATVLAGTVTGSLVDRLGAVRLLPLFLVPAALGLLALAATDHPAAATAFMALVGATQGLGATLIQALWAELYGTRHLGAIRALAQAAMVLGTALGPILFGLAFDAGVTVEAAALASAAWLVVMTLLLRFGLKREPAPVGA